MKFQLLLVLSCVALAWGQSGNADAYLDEILNNARNNPEVRAKIDPLRVDNISFNKGSVSDISIHGLLNLARTGPATLSALENGNFAIDAQLGLNQVTGNGRWRYRALFRFSGGLSAKVDRISCRLRIVTQNGKATLQNFSVDSMSGLKVTKFSGASFALNWLGKKILNIVVDKNRGRIRGRIESAGGEAISKALEKVNIDNFLPRL